MCVDQEVNSDFSMGFLPFFYMRCVKTCFVRMRVSNLCVFSVFKLTRVTNNIVCLCAPYYKVCWGCMYCTRMFYLFTPIYVHTINANSCGHCINMHLNTYKRYLLLSPLSNGKWRGWPMLPRHGRSQRRDRGFPVNYSGNRALGLDAHRDEGDSSKCTQNTTSIKWHRVLPRSRRNNRANTGRSFSFLIAGDARHRPK